MIAIAWEAGVVIETVIRLGFAVLVLFMALRGYSEFKNGTLRIENNDKEPIVWLRSERPFAFWSAIAGFYAVLLIILAALAFAPSL